VKAERKKGGFSWTEETTRFRQRRHECSRSAQLAEREANYLYAKGDDLAERREETQRREVEWVGFRGVEE